MRLLGAARFLAHALLDMARGDRAIGADVIGPAGSAIWRNTGRPIFIEFSKYSSFTPQVPSWPAQRSTVFTSVPGIDSSISRVFWPMFCTREWQGTWYDTLPSPCLKSVLSRPVFLSQHEILERVEHRVAHRDGVGVVRVHERQLLLEHQRAGGHRR